MAVKTFSNLLRGLIVLGVVMGGSQAWARAPRHAPAPRVSAECLGSTDEAMVLAVPKRAIVSKQAKSGVLVGVSTPSCRQAIAAAEAPKPRVPSATAFDGGPVKRVRSSGHGGATPPLAAPVLQGRDTALGQNPLGLGLYPFGL